MSRVLLIKTSSLGDVIHCLPAVSDMLAGVPGLRLDWLVEEGLAEIPRLHGDLAGVIPIPMRRWRRAPLAASTRAEMAGLKRDLRAAGYQRVIDAQGLIRTAWLGRLAGAPLSGYDLRSIREPLASVWYDRKFAVSVTVHAAERMRRLAAQAMGYDLPAEADYGLSAAPIRPTWLPEGRYLVALHATARPDKAWDEANWIALTRLAAMAGLTVVAPWGSPAERERSKRIVAAVAGAIAPPRLSYTELAGVIAGAAAVVGVDTGLTHLASAVGAPVVALYLASWAEFNGVIGPGFIANLGGPGETPSVEAVWAQTQKALAHGRRTGPWRMPDAPSAAELGKRRRFRPSNSRAVIQGR